MQVKLDELLRVTAGAHNALLDLEELEEHELERIRGGYTRLAERARGRLRSGEPDTDVPETDADGSLIRFTDLHAHRNVCLAVGGYSVVDAAVGPPRRACAASPQIPAESARFSSPAHAVTAGAPLALRNVGRSEHQPPVSRPAASTTSTLRQTGLHTRQHGRPRRRCPRTARAPRRSALRPNRRLVMDSTEHAPPSFLPSVHRVRAGGSPPWRCSPAARRAARRARGAALPAHRRRAAGRRRRARPRSLADVPRHPASVSPRPT